MTETPLEILAAELKRLHRDAGNPSSRTIESRIKKYVSHTTISKVLKGTFPPRWETLEAIVGGLGGDTDNFKRLWRAVLDYESPLPRQPPPHATSPARAAGPIREDSYPPADTWLGDRRGLHISEPVLFIGLGGTGCDIGAVLERRLRHEWCGPDGCDFRRLSPRNGHMLPYQLPSCVQFVYADVNQRQLGRMAERVVPNAAHIAAATLTASYVRWLPDVATYPVLAMRLRLTMKGVVDGWLPPDVGEPGGSLNIGAAQFPTVGRATLFGAMAYEGVRPLVNDLGNAVHRLAASGEDLHLLGGRPPRGISVFVAFSAAGGTGAGIFYDFLHLIVDTVYRQNIIPLTVYPLVVMPSAFPEGLGGGRSASLNAARTLMDMIRLVDSQNGSTGRRWLRGAHEQHLVDPDDPAVIYPDNTRLVPAPGSIRTVFLFPKPPSADRSDLHRTISSLILSIIGEGSRDDHWVDAGAARYAQADDGIGNRGVSTALIASLTSPSHHLADLISGRLLREAIKQLSAADSKDEPSWPGRDQFLRSAGLGPLLITEILSFSEADTAQGAPDITARLADRLDAMRQALAEYPEKAAAVVSRFDPDTAIRNLLKSLDVFRVARAVSETDLDEDPDPSPPDKVAPDSPIVPVLADRFRRPVRWGDPVPVEARRAQDDWYRWQSSKARAEAWRHHRPYFRQSLQDPQRSLQRLTRALIDFAQLPPSEFARQTAELYRVRAGVTYLLPLGGVDIEQLYVLIKSRLATRGSVPDTAQQEADEATIVQSILAGSDGWSTAYEITSEGRPEDAIASIRDLITTEVRQTLRAAPDGHSPLFPRMSNLLAEAAGHSRGDLSLGQVEEFHDKLGTLLPPRFTPQGVGPMKVMISYPAESRDPVTEAYLRESINLPRGPGIVYQMDATHAQSIDVLMFRTSMGLTDIPEARDALRGWAEATAKPEPHDYLPWRQRLGYRFGYLVTTPDRRAEILQRLLCAMWNGKVRVEGDPASPAVMAVEFALQALTLRLSSLDGASSWGSLVSAYELAALGADDTQRLSCANLMRELPDGIDSIPRPPAPLYLTLRNSAEAEITRLDAILSRPADVDRDRAALMHRFWTEILPSALALDFPSTYHPVASSLRDLERVVDSQQY